MRKSTKLLKKFAALFLLVLMSIDTMAAVVSDNDGAAFITKAEFDSLKNTFQAQINQYNSSINNKIDNAIAQYIAGVKKVKTSNLTCLYKKYTIQGNKDADIIYWCSNNNISFCTTTSQKLAMNYTYVQGYVHAGVGKGGYWNANMDSETYDRQRKRWTLDKEGYITGRYIWKFWFSGSMTGVIYKDISAPGGNWFTNECINQINTRTPKTYVSTTGYNTDTNNWWQCSSFYYYEESLNTNENMPLYPLSEKNDEQVVNMSVQTPTITANDRLWLNSHAETQFTLSNIRRLGGFPLFTSNGDFNDYIQPTISGVFKKMKLSDFKYRSFHDVSEGNEEIAKGVVVTQATDNGKIVIKGKCDYNGYLILYNAASGSLTWNGNRSSRSDATSWKTSLNQVTANTEWTRTLNNVKNGEYIYVIYAPTSTSNYGQITFNSIVQTSDN